MSRGSADVIRQPLVLKPRSRRRLGEHLVVRFPRLVALLGGLVWRLPPRSRLRRAIVRRAVISGWTSFNRRDAELAFALYHPDVESTIDSQLLSLGFEQTQRHESRVAELRRWAEEIGEFRFESEELILIGGDQVVTIGRMKGSGSISGAPFDNDWAQIFTLSAGQVVHEQIFLERSAALKAAGLAD